MLHAEVLRELDLSERFVYLPAEKGRLWKGGPERGVRQGCNTMGVHRRGVHGFRGTAVCECVEIKRAEGDTAFQRVTNYAKKPGQVAVSDRH